MFFSYQAQIYLLRFFQTVDDVIRTSRTGLIHLMMNTLTNLYTI